MNGHHCQQDEWKLSALADGELPADEAEAVVQTLAEVVQELKKISPLGKEDREKED